MIFLVCFHNVCYSESNIHNSDKSGIFGEIYYSDEFAFVPFYLNDIKITCF